MSSERWERVKQIYAAALEVEPGRREKFLREACGGDDSLLEEVRSLLAQGGKSEDVLESPPLQVVARVLAAEGAHDSPEDLSGRMLSHSRLEEKIGQGGMGVSTAPATRFSGVLSPSKSSLRFSRQILTGCAISCVRPRLPRRQATRTSPRFMRWAKPTVSTSS